jgi:FkbM family methyltransferase
MLQKLRQLRWSGHLFADLGSAWRYANISSTKDGQPVELRLRGLDGGIVLCRRGSSDPQVLWETFQGAAHLPRRNLPDLATIVDLGSNVGYTLLPFASLYPAVRLIGVEPDPGNMSIARRNVQRLGSRCVLIEAAIWTSDGEICYGGEQEWGYSVIGDRLDKRARSLTLQTLFREASLAMVDYLKMDIEGAEAAIFLQDLSWAEVVRSMHIEVHPPAERDDIINRLTALGYTCEVEPRLHPAIYAERRR